MNCDHRGGENGSYTNSYKPNGESRPSGTLNGLVSSEPSPSDTPLYLSTFNGGQRSSEALLNAAECYFEGVSTRDIGKISDLFGSVSMLSTQVSNTSEKLDEGFEAWRNCKLGEFLYLILDARYEKQRQNGKVVSVMVLSAIGVDREGQRRAIGLTFAQSEAQIHWREFLESLVERGLCGVKFIVSDDHVGLNAARREVFPNATWQGCHFHLTQNAKKHAPNKAIRNEIAKELRKINDAENLEQANNALNDLVDKYSKIAPILALWLKINVPEALSVFSLPKEHQVSMRTSNLIERAINQQI